MLLRKLIILTCLIALPGLGCARIIANKVAREVAKARSVQYIELKRQQRWEEALDVIRAEAKDPMLNDPKYIAQIHILVIGALGDVANFKGLPPEFDAEAKQHYDAAKQIAGTNPTLQAQVTWIYALYFSKSRRNRMALPHMRDAYAVHQTAGNLFGQMQVMDGMASTYSDMGELELADHYRNTALGMAAAYFQWPSSPEDPNEWLFYSDMLKKHNDRLAGEPGSPAKIKKNWAVIKPIVDTHIEPKYISYFDVAQHLALSGDHAAAGEIFSQGLAHNWAVKPEFTDLAAVDRECIGALIDQHAGRNKDALAKLGSCEAARAKAGFTQVDPAFERTRGAIYEDNGRLADAVNAYKRSVDEFEKIRAAIPVEERASFFRSIARKSSWGLIRATTRQFTTSRKPQDYVTALRASDNMRARQLAELTAGRGQAVELSSLEQLRAKLGPGHAMIGFVLTDQEVLIYALNATEMVAKVVPHQGKMTPKLAAITQQLGKKGAGVSKSRLDADMDQFSRFLLRPVRSVLAGQSRITFVPDGLLGAFPIELLVDPDSGKPLIDKYVVATAPSVSLFLRDRPAAGASKRMLAVGDPSYKPPPAGVGYASKEDVAAVSRASDFLRYFKRLPETRTEVESIATLFKGTTAMYLGDEARESQLKGASLKGYGYLHFATHGVLGGEVPGMPEPALVLAAEDGQDGFLTASEAAALRLDANLTVLSACNTGSGKVSGGEGVMGMSRSFLLAGSRSVVVSLWPVNSKATEALMVRLYEHHRRGLDTSSALREAKLDIMRKRGWEHPYYWAAFVVVGEGSSLRASGKVAKRGTGEPAAKAEPAKPTPKAERGLEFTNTENAPAPGPAAGTFADDFAIRSPFKK